ncbi:ribosome small subunit-dependent GTPase A [Nitrosomonas marina]|uniref:Small ribosomal subunit biogenesis GTPase RsgA n=1 Tax=Nitrosomonas marina TaxID=917 RepID=A0A1H8GCF3_9PROT|nr:ribosome small subunit-dependent GTPase A [Nitrosomonas marina]SEN41424.1 ribosome biogenesis GTPase [Nitrosomonas marina]
MNALQQHDNSHQTGLVIAVFGRHYSVETAEGELLSCVMRGKKGGVACGDKVTIRATGTDQGVIEAIHPRKTLLYRSDAFKEKIIAANVSQIIIVIAAVPSYSEELVNRCLIAAESQKIRSIIVLNKTDLAEPTQNTVETLSLYEAIGYPLIKVSAIQNISPLRPFLKNQLSVLAGQSGMGKSTLLNALVPGAQRATADISTALDSGCHTTTHSRLFHLDTDSAIIDSPGIQAFGLHHVSNEDMAWCFVEFRPYIGHCRFHNCRHLNEPGCALILAADKGKISDRRLMYYQKLQRH